ncbi:MAG: RnfABCDGE type electron transport complex subunit D [Lachnospiraceae bacterium]|nr:RnfABCDGE type electron transport complex subunit D [Lachnospiraceae bacterium]
MNKKLNVSASPHVRSKDSTSSIMRDVVIAMVPAAVLGIFNAFKMGTSVGINAILIIAVCIAVSVLAEYVYEKGMKKPITIGDYSAAVTGLILALNMPPYIAPWIPAIGCVFAIVIVKQLYGGLGQNFMNPALAGRCFLLISFAGPMTQFFADGVSAATPLAELKANGLASMLGQYSLTDMATGMIPGTIGETSAIALLVGAAYMLYKKVISWRIPVTYIATVAVFALIFGADGMFNFQYMLAHVLGGGLIFGAFFMATDYVTSPITPNGQIVFGICLGLLTGIFRIFGGSAEGVSYAIIFCNLLVPLIEKFTMPVPFGKEKK